MAENMEDSPIFGELEKCLLKILPLIEKLSMEELERWKEYYITTISEKLGRIINLRLSHTKLIQGELGSAKSPLEGGIIKK